MGPAGALTQDSLRHVLRAVGIDAPSTYKKETGSTNADATDLAGQGAPEWTLVATGHQTGGRGRLGRTWTDRPGQALMFSVILRPPIGPEDAPLVSLLAAASMAQACRRQAGVEADCKWPNDLVVGERKTGGILAEARVADGRLDHVILGIGMNVSMDRDAFPEEIRDAATSLALEGGKADPAGLLEAFLREFREAYRPDDEAFPAAAVRRYRERCRTLGKKVRATTVAGDTIEGAAVDVGERGALIVDAPGGRAAVGFGEIAHLD